MSRLLASSIGHWPADSLRSSWGHPLVGASGKAARSSGAARHLFPGTAAAAEPAGRKRNRAHECSPAEQQVTPHVPSACLCTKLHSRCRHLKQCPCLLAKSNDSRRHDSRRHLQQHAAAASYQG